MHESPTIPKKRKKALSEIRAHSGPIEVQVASGDIAHTYMAVPNEAAINTVRGLRVEDIIFPYTFKGAQPTLYLSFREIPQEMQLGLRSFDKNN